MILLIPLIPLILLESWIVATRSNRFTFGKGIKKIKGIKNLT
jgi:hypothetical protein